MKTRTRVPKRRDLAGGYGQEYADHFNRRFPIGSRVWYWQTLPFGPVIETTIRSTAIVIDEGNSNPGMVVCYLQGVSGYVSVAHVTAMKEDQRGSVTFKWRLADQVPT